MIGACVHRKYVPLDLFEASKPSKKEKAVKLLSIYELIKRRPVENSLGIHQPVHDYVQVWLQLPGRLRFWENIVMERLSDIFPQHFESARSK